MNIRRIRIKNLFGYLNKVIEFNQDINLLVGINGSGKTSILNVINWLITPSFFNLCINEFEELEMDFYYNGIEYKIFGKQNEKEVSISLEDLSGITKFPTIQADLRIDPKNFRKNDDVLDELNHTYKSLIPDKNEEKTWNFLFSEIPNPIVIGLDRNLYVEDGEDVSFVRSSIEKRIINKRRSKKDPIEKVKILSTKEYVGYKNTVLKLNRELNERIISSSFDETITLDNIVEMTAHAKRKISKKQVEDLELKVKEYFEENIEDEKHNKLSEKKKVISKIEKYFSNFKKILNIKSDEYSNILYITNLNQFKKINELIKYFEMFESEKNRVYEPIKNYLDAINLFFKDSAKELYFDKDNSELKFRILDEKNELVRDGLEIEGLSSGEKQIIILFTYIKFNKNDGKVFIIDEPELSLHPKWQENFIEGIKKIMPEDTQLLFATHSPAVVGKDNKKYCKVLLPY